jgi:parallel beta-helix repeat protein
VTNCTFIGNSAITRGGGMYNREGSQMVAGCTFSGNLAADMGGGMYNYESTPTLSNCTFSGNSAQSGGGMINLFNSLTLINCIFSNNSAGAGGGIYNEESSPVLTNCTFSGNSAVDGNALACDSYQQLGPSNVEMTSCILWDGGGEIWNNDGSTITINYSDVQGGWGGPGGNNIDEDPLFIGPNGLDGIPGTADDEDGNLHLSPTISPCINVGDPFGDYSGQVDLDGQPRLAYGRVDMGADEVFPIAGDFEPDGDVDFGDFAIFALNWLLGVE